MSNENKTILRLEVDKTIQPQQFEPIKVQVSVEESFYWKDNTDRTKKMEAYIEKITEDFITSFNHVVTKIGEENRCIGLVTTVGNVPVDSKETVKNDSSDDEFSFD